MKNILFLLLFIPIIVFAQAPMKTNKAYKNEIITWRENRVKSLKSEKGWLNIVGLYWLKQGENTIGSGAENRIILPQGKANENLGTIILKDSLVTFAVQRNSIITANDAPFNNGVIYTGKDESAVILTHKTLKWFVIKRGNNYALRLRDLESDALKNFTHIDYFDITSKWRIEATLEPPVPGKTIPINDIIGLTTETPFGGTLHFDIDGKHYQLDATAEGDDLFIVFADETTGNETYGGGRFLYAKKPKDGTNKVILDFNKAYNPPCCFTNFATCPLPSAQNRLAVKVLAGEKKYEHH